MVPAHGVRVVRHDGLASVPWRNGRGTTREVASRPDPRRPDSFLWRVSIADVAVDGPFSTFAGVDRVSLLVDDARVDVVVDGASTRLQRFDPFRYAGEATTTVQLGSGSVRLLNVMTARGVTGADVSVVRGSTVDIAAEGSDHLLVMLEGVGVLARPGAEDPTIEPLDSVLAPAAHAVTLDISHGVAALVRFA